MEYAQFNMLMELDEKNNWGLGDALTDACYILKLGNGHCDLAFLDEEDIIGVTAIEELEVGHAWENPWNKREILTVTEIRDNEAMVVLRK